MTNPIEVLGWVPGVVRIYPRHIYKNWRHFSRTQYVYCPDVLKSPNKKIVSFPSTCMIRILESTHHAIWKEDPRDVMRLEEELESAKKFGWKITFSPNDHVRILKNYGISKERYKGRIK